PHQHRRRADARIASAEYGGADPRWQADPRTGRRLRPVRNELQGRADQGARGLQRREVRRHPTECVDAAPDSLTHYRWATTSTGCGYTSSSSPIAAAIVTKGMAAAIDISSPVDSARSATTNSSPIGAQSPPAP